MDVGGLGVCLLLLGLSRSQDLVDHHPKGYQRERILVLRFYREKITIKIFTLYSANNNNIQQRGETSQNFYSEESWN